jgi:protein phosphatase
MHGRGSGVVRSFAMFGETTGETDEFGLPIRLNWARDYRGKAVVVYGHTPVYEPEWLNDTICIDTGCVFGGKLTALRWPERELVSVPAAKEYVAPAKPLVPASGGPTAQQENDRILYFDDYTEKRRIETRFGKGIMIPPQNALAALEVASRFAVDPRWMVYLPPTMAPCPTASEGPFLEHPTQALDYYVERGVTDIVAEEKHMGSRALLVVACNTEAARTRFGVEDGKAGVIYTRTGRPFLDDDSIEAVIIARIGEAIDKAGLWKTLETDWVLLDAELMPWSAKAQGLLQRQYSPTVAAAKASAEALLSVLSESQEFEGLEQLRIKAAAQFASADRMQRTIAGYCWNVAAVDDYRIAPFHLLAAEGHVFSDHPHTWHMDKLSRLAEHDPILQMTTWRHLDASSESDRIALISWWQEHTGAGGEGMVIKPTTFVAKGEKGLVQPAMKVRGRDYLRIIYGPDYDLPENIERLRTRALSRKFSLAQREFALGVEGLMRFVDYQPLRRVHECALGVLALESEPVDPRL